MLKLKKLCLIMSVTCFSVVSHSQCLNPESLISAAAKKTLSKDEAITSVYELPKFLGKTKNKKKDKWVTSVVVNEECITRMIIYTKHNSCDVINALEIGERDCG